MVEESHTAPGATGRDLDVKYYLDLARRHWVFLVASAVVGLFLGLVVAFMQTPVYRAAAMLQIEPPTPAFLTVNEALGPGGYWQNADFYNTQFRVLKSPTLGRFAVERMKVGDRAPFAGSRDPGGIFMGHVSVEPVPESRLVVLAVMHTDPKEAALWVNTLADVYIEQSLASRVDAAQQAYQWLQDRLATTQSSMKSAQEKLLKTQGPDLLVGEGSVSASASSIAKLSEDYMGLQSRRIGVESVLKQLTEMKQAGKSLDTVPQVASDEIVRGLNAQTASLQIELGKLLEKFKEAHPQVQRVRGQIEDARKAREARAAQITDGLRAEFAQLQRQEAELRIAMDQQRSQAAAQSQKATEFEILRKEATSAAGLYDALLQKLKEADIAQSVRSNNITITDRAIPPASPVRPRKSRIAMLGLLAGIALGVGLVLLRDYLDDTFHGAEEIERYLHVDVLASVPRYTSELEYPVVEAYQSLRTALLFAQQGEGGQVVLITGTAPQEGKTTTLLNLAGLLAASGERTLVVDCDLRRAQIHHRLGLAREPGLSEVFLHHAEVETLVRPTRTPNLFALTAGQLPPNPPAVLGRRDVAQFFDRLRKSFDWILVDSPPLASVTDGLLLARHADLVLLVVQFNHVDKRLVKRSLAALRKASENVLGVVMNAVDMKSERYGGYYYYYASRAEGAKRQYDSEPTPPRSVGSRPRPQMSALLTLTAALLILAPVSPLLAADPPKVQVSEPGSPKAKSGARRSAGLSVGSLAFASGLVERSTDGRKWSRLKAGDTIRTGDRIRTGADGLARLRLPWMTVTTAPSSVVSFPAEVVLATELESGRVEMHALSGEIVKVRSAGVEVRGAGWVVIRRATSAAGVQVMALEGSFRLSNEEGASTLRAGTGTTVRAGGPPDAPVTAPAGPGWTRSLGRPRVRSGRHARPSRVESHRRRAQPPGLAPRHRRARPRSGRGSAASGSAALAPRHLPVARHGARRPRLRRSPLHGGAHLRRGPLD